MPVQPNGSAKNNLLRIFSFGKNNATIFFSLLFVLSAVFAAPSSAAQNATYERLANSETSNYKLIGSTAKLATIKASAYAANAVAGQILISNATAEDLDGKFDLQALPPLKVKGRSTPLEVFNVKWKEKKRSAKAKSSTV